MPDAWTPSPNQLCEMRVGFGAGDDLWIPVEPQSYPAPLSSLRESQTACPIHTDGQGADDASFTLVRTWPGVSWSAVWVPTNRLRDGSQSIHDRDVAAAGGA